MGNADGEAGPTAVLPADDSTDACSTGFFRMCVCGGWGTPRGTARAERRMWPLRSKCPQTVHQSPGQRRSRSGSRAGIQPSVARSEGGAYGGSSACWDRDKGQGRSERPVSRAPHSPDPTAAGRRLPMSLPHSLELWGPRCLSLEGPLTGAGCLPRPRKEFQISPTGMRDLL